MLGDVPDVAAPTSADETDGNNVPPLAVLVDVEPSVKGSTRDKKPGAIARRELDDVGNEPFGELPCSDARRRRCGVLIVERRRTQSQPANAEQLLELGNQTRFLDVDLARWGPVVKSCNEYGVIGEIN